MTPVVCHKCEHYYITWDKNFPHGCRGIGFKSREAPNIVVRRISGMDCFMFKKKLRNRKEIAK